MKTFLVQFDYGVTTYQIHVRARHHEEAEHEALRLTKVPYCDIGTMQVKIISEN